MNDKYFKALFSWNYFCTLCEMLKNTMNYIDHSDKKNMKVYSFELRKIIILTAVEFENVGKCLCEEINPSINSSKFNIIEITKPIINEYKKIKTIKINNDYNTYQPLRGWGVDSNNKLKGLKWWNEYNEIKHQSYISYNKSTLENAINALGSLMILDLYYVRKLTGSNKIFSNIRCPYFYNQYQNKYLLCEDEKLPDNI